MIIQQYGSCIFKCSFISRHSCKVCLFSPLYNRIFWFWIIGLEQTRESKGKKRTKNSEFPRFYPCSETEDTNSMWILKSSSAHPLQITVSMQIVSSHLHCLIWMKLGISQLRINSSKILSLFFLRVSCSVKSLWKQRRCKSHQDLVLPKVTDEVSSAQQSQRELIRLGRVFESCWNSCTHTPWLSHPALLALLVFLMAS